LAEAAWPIVEAVLQSPDILLLDEPTNHLDLLQSSGSKLCCRAAPFACVGVSQRPLLPGEYRHRHGQLNRTYPRRICRGSPEGYQPVSWRRRKNSCMPIEAAGSAGKSGAIEKSSGCRRERKHGQESPRRGIDKAGELMGRACRFECEKPQRKRAH